MDSNDSSKYLTPVERIYREISKPSSSKAVPKKPDAASPLDLKWADVEAILAHQRDATPEELSYVIEHAKEFSLSKSQRNDVSVRLTIALANRGRPAANPHAELFNTLDIVETPVGLLHNRSWFERELRDNAKRILQCTRHTPPRCSCWKEARQRLWHVQDSFGARSPESWMATRIYEMCEEMEFAKRPELGLATVSRGVPLQTEYFN